MPNYADMNMTNTTNILDMAIYLDRVLNNWFGRSVLITVFVIFFIYFTPYGNARALTAASFITSIIGALMVAAGILIPTDYVFALVFLYGAVLLMVAARKYAGTASDQT